MAGEIVQVRGARAIDTSGSDSKVDWVRDVAGLDNVGGALLEVALDNLTTHARIALCGSVSSGYTASAYGLTPANYMQRAFKRARMEGFSFLDHDAGFPDALADLSAWVASGDLHWEEDVVDGLDAAPAALQ